MAFFSLSVALSVAGVKPSDLKQADLSRSGLRRTYYTTSARVVKYYENIRLVYEIESRVREFKRVTTPAEPGPKEKERDKTRKEQHQWTTRAQTGKQLQPRREPARAGFCSRRIHLPCR